MWIGINGIWIGRNSGGGVVVPDGAPSNLVLMVISDTEIDGTFTEGSTNQDGFRVYISTDNITFTEKTTVLSGSFQATGLTEHTHYWFKITAYKGATESGYSNTDDEVTLPTILLDGNTKVSIFGHIVGNLTKDISNRVSAISSLIGQGLTCAVQASQPLWNMVETLRFDGTNDYLQSGAFTLNQPLRHYFVAKQQSQTLSDRFIDGLSATAMVEQYTSNVVRANAGSYSGTTATFGFHFFKIGRYLVNGASCKLQFNELTAITGNWGANNPGGVTIGASRALTANWWNGEYKCLITRSIADTAGNETIIYNYLFEKYFNGRNINMVWEGHSMINLLEVDGDICVTDYTEEKLKRYYGIKLRHSCNVATGGYSIDQITADYATRVTANKDATLGVVNYLTLFIGANDIAGGETGLSAYNALKSYVDQAIVDGWVPIIITMTKYGIVAGVETNRNIFNNLIRANTDWSYIVDTDLVPELVDNTNTTYFNADKIHLISAGSERLANALYQKIKEAIDDNS